MSNSYKTSNLGPRVSHTTTKAFTAGPGHYLVPSWMTFEADGPVKLDGAVTATAAQAFSGNVAVTGSLAVGASGTSIGAIRGSTISVSLGAIAPWDSVSTTATISLMPADAVVLAIQPTSIWSGAYYDITMSTLVSAASTLVISAVNSTLTSVTPAAQNMTVWYIDPS